MVVMTGGGGGGGACVCVVGEGWSVCVRARACVPVSLSRTALNIWFRLFECLCLSVCLPPCLSYKNRLSVCLSVCLSVSHCPVMSRNFIFYSWLAEQSL